MELKERAHRHIERMDFVVRAAEIKWGIPLMLTTLIEPDLAGKFQRQWQALSAAISECRDADVIELTDGAIRGIWAMERAALDAGHKPNALSPIGVAPKEPEAATEKVNKINVPPDKFWKDGGDSIPF